MAKARARRWTLYSDDSDDASRPDIFAAADSLDYPDAEWWADVAPPSRPRRDRPPAPPTRATYWEDRSPRRLLSALPLRGESKAAGRQRARMARRYFAQLANYLYRQRAGEGAGSFEWRVVAHGELVAVVNRTMGPEKLLDGRQSSPWQHFTGGTHIADAVVRARVLDTGRRAVALTAKHAPDWPAALGTFTESKGYTDSDGGIVFPSAIVLEVRRAA